MNDSARQTALSFAHFGARLLRELAADVPGVDLAPLLAEASQLLAVIDVRIECGDDSVLVGGVSVAPEVGRTWHEYLRAGAVESVEFTRQTSGRELLKFLALLVARGDAHAFVPLWTEYGAWRIRVRGPGGEEAAAATHPSGEHPTASTMDMRALLEQLASTTAAPHRRALYEAILARESSHEHLIEALSHPSWFVVRNAAALLGEQRVMDADHALAALLCHPEPRVRVAATAALGQLYSATAQAALASATRDADASVRAQVWRSWSAAPDAPPLFVIDDAMRRETAPDAQRAILDCAAQFPELEVTDALLRLCARLFSQGGSPELCTLALEQLAQRRPHRALPFVRRLAKQWRGTVRGG